MPQSSGPLPLALADMWLSCLPKGLLLVFGSTWSVRCIRQSFSVQVWSCTAT